MTSARVTQQTSTSLAVDWVKPDTRAEGANGGPINSYTVQIATPVKEIQVLNFTDPTGQFLYDITLGFTLQNVNHTLLLTDGFY